MIDYTVKKQKNGVVVFKNQWGIKTQTIQKNKKGEYECRCCFGSGGCLCYKYASKETAIERSIEYMSSLAFDGIATFNGQSGDFIYELL